MDNQRKARLEGLIKEAGLGSAIMKGGRKVGRAIESAGDKAGQAVQRMNRKLQNATDLRNPVSRMDRAATKAKSKAHSGMEALKKLKNDPAARRKLKSKAKSKLSRAVDDAGSKLDYKKDKLLDKLLY